MTMLPCARGACRSLFGSTPRWTARPQWKALPLSVGRHRYATSKTASLQKTPLYDLHVAHSAKMVSFAGYSMPLQYEDLSIGDSHRWTREKASLFDVGHMVQHRISGPGATDLLLRLTPASLTRLKGNQSTLSCLLHPGTGGIVDDTIITRLGPELFYLVTNAACREKDTAYLSEHIRDWTSKAPSRPRGVEWEVLDGWGLIALQGPLSAAVLEPLVADEEVDLKELYFGQSRFLSLHLSRPSAASGEKITDTTPPLLVSRGGYTGEDGFEISTPPGVALPLAQSLLRSAGPSKLRLAGLGARDSLRLEAGMCLYGHDLDDNTTPVEASLGWIVGADRRTDPTGFFGADVILSQLQSAEKVERKRVGFVLEGAGGAGREGAVIVDGQDPDKIIGTVTSGCPSPTLGKNIAMGYVQRGFHRQGTEVGIKIRGKIRKAHVCKMPFVPTKYWRSPVVER